MDIFYHKDMADGTYNKDTSEIDERVKSMVFAEAAKVVITKKESEVFEHIYDSTEQGSFSSLYESVFEIYKKLSGIRLCSNISISKFSKLATYLPKSLKITKIDLELMFKKLQYDETSVIGLITFFTAMVKIAKKYEYNPESLIEETYSNILS
jgi:ribosome-binding ATPase YchF (GTP1/OBG family)